MKEPCGCCEGVEAITPVPLANRPGLSALAYRAGTHATFLATMQARLSSYSPVLKGLTTRQPDDPSMAMLDAWAMVADVLTFYQERLANEGYLRTATERRSVLELARLVGYTPRPGVASSVYLAYAIETGQEVTIPAGTRAQSVPGPGEQLQSFETSDDLKARGDWNELKPRTTRPQNITRDNVGALSVLYVRGAATRVGKGDRLLFDFDDDIDPVPRIVADAVPEPAIDRVRVVLQDDLLKPRPGIPKSSQSFLDVLRDFRGPLSKPPSRPPANSRRLGREFLRNFGPESDVRTQLLTRLLPQVDTGQLYAAIRNAAVNPTPLSKVYIFRKGAFLYGHNSPQKMKSVTTEEPAVENRRQTVTKSVPDGEWKVDGEDPNTVYLDRVYEQLGKDGWVLIEIGSAKTAEPPTRKAYQIERVAERSRREYGSTIKVSELRVKEKWWRGNNEEDFGVILRTTVYIQSEQLELAEEPVGLPVEGRWIELDRLVLGPESGRWLIVSGERLLAGSAVETSGVRASELVMLDSVEQSATTRLAPGATDEKPVALPGDKLHTTLRLAEPLEYKFKRDTVTISANVVRATHGETRTEVLGSGDGGIPLQDFALRQGPLTHVSAPTPAGTKSTLKVDVNKIDWEEKESLIGLRPTDQVYVTRTDDEDKTTLTFGDGRHGARLPTGVENVRAIYRTGIGLPGNVKPGQISLLATRPLGVRGVSNPLPASGGADREDRDQARRNVPLRLLALERAVSVRDFEFFARTFAGVGKARAVRRPPDRGDLDPPHLNRRLAVHLTIAGAGGSPIQENSELVRNLEKALRDHGDPTEPAVLVLAKRRALVIEAGVALQPRYLWEGVEPRVRSALLSAYSFDRRDLGQPVFLSEAVHVIQQVEGVASVNVTRFVGLDVEQILSALKEDFAPVIAVNDDEILYVRPDEPENLILKVVTP